MVPQLRPLFCSHLTPVGCSNSYDVYVKVKLLYNICYSLNDEVAARQQQQQRHCVTHRYSRTQLLPGSGDSYSYSYILCLF